MQPQTGSVGQYRANKCGFDGGGSDGRRAGVCEGRELGGAWQIHAFDRRAIGNGLRRGYRWRGRRNVLNGMGDRENRRSFPVFVGGSVVIVIVMGRVIVAVTLVIVIADVEVKVEEAGAKLAVAVPVLGGVETETAGTDDGDHPQDRAGQPGTSDHGSAETSHLETPRRFYRSRPQ